jgi:hypothetical protein
LGLIHTLLNPHTCELLYLFPSPRSAFSSSLHLSRPLSSRLWKVQDGDKAPHRVFGEGLQDWVL